MTPTGSNTLKITVVRRRKSKSSLIQLKSLNISTKYMYRIIGRNLVFYAIGNVLRALLFPIMKNLFTGNLRNCRKKIFSFRNHTLRLPVLNAGLLPLILLRLTFLKEGTQKKMNTQY